MKKITIIFLLFFSLLTISGYAEDGYDFIYFGTSGCLDCMEVENFLEEIPEINYISYNISNREERELLYQYNSTYNTKEVGMVPIIFFESDYLAGTDDIITNFEDYLEQTNKVKLLDPDINHEIYDNSLETLNTFLISSVLIAGLIDGFNPCAIAMLLFFTTFLSSTNLSIFKVSSSFILGIFVAYFGIGMGLFQFAYLFRNAEYFLMIIYIVTIAMSLIFAFMNLYDYIMIKKRKFNHIKNQLPKGIKHKIHNFIRKNMTSKRVMIAAFITGFVISFLEFFCTGQIYLPTITLVLSYQITNVGALFYLFLYNIMFVSPLIAISYFIYKGKKIMDVSQSLIEHLAKIKITVFIFFVIIAAFMTYNFLELF